MAEDLGLQIGATIHSDANAALGIVAREGLGKLRHVRVQYLWIQDRIRGGELTAEKVRGPDNPADLLTKHLPAQEVVRHTEYLGQTLHDSRAAAAPALANFSTISIKDPEEDIWRPINDDGRLRRCHARPRRQLFTPIRVAGSPPGKALTAVRITEGVFNDNGEAFRIADNWTARSTAHQDLGRLWTGSTTFVLRSR